MDDYKSSDIYKEFEKYWLEKNKDKKFPKYIELETTLPQFR
jgi:hypothetical protein